jgi:hypothetical protein
MDEKRAARRKVTELVKRVFANLTSQLATGTADLWRKVEQRLSQTPRSAPSDAAQARTAQPAQQQPSKPEDERR